MSWFFDVWFETFSIRYALSSIWMRTKVVIHLTYEQSKVKAFSESLFLTQVKILQQKTVHINSFRLSTMSIIFPGDIWRNFSSCFFTSALTSVLWHQCNCRFSQGCHFESCCDFIFYLWQAFEFHPTLHSCIIIIIIINIIISLLEKTSKHK